MERNVNYYYHDNHYYYNYYEDNHTEIKPTSQSEFLIDGKLSYYRRDSLYL